MFEQMQPATPFFEQNNFFPAMSPSSMPPFPPMTSRLPFHQPTMTPRPPPAQVVNNSFSASGERIIPIQVVRAPSSQLISQPLAQVK
jgi:hypothetical protein